jgi:hypothetical protein
LPLSFTDEQVQLVEMLVPPSQMAGDQLIKIPTKRNTSGKINDPADDSLLAAAHRRNQYISASPSSPSVSSTQPKRKRKGRACRCVVLRLPDW